MGKASTVKVVLRSGLFAEVLSKKTYTQPKRLQNVSRLCFGVDWGASRLRLFVFDGDDSLLGSIERGQGMGVLDRDRYEALLMQDVGPFLGEGGLYPVVCCGMVGARQSWSGRFSRLPASGKEVNTRRDGAIRWAGEAPDLGAGLDLWPGSYTMQFADRVSFG